MREGGHYSSSYRRASEGGRERTGKIILEKEEVEEDKEEAIKNKKKDKKG